MSTRSSRRRCTPRSGSGSYSNNKSSRNNKNTISNYSCISMKLTIALLTLALTSSPASSFSAADAHHATSSTSTALLSGTSTEAGISTTTTCVPPPNSRLAQLLRHQQSQSLPGTKNRQSGRQRPSKHELRYASYPQEDSERSAAAAASAAASLRRVQIQSKQRQRARMLRSFPKRLSFHRQRKFQQTSNSNSNNNNDDHDGTTTTNNNKKARHRQELTTEEYQQRKAAWAAKYTSVSSLRTTFGTNKNKLFGDFDPVTTRKLYHTLLPRALLELRGLRDMITLGSGGDDDDDGLVDDHDHHQSRGGDYTSSTSTTTTTTTTTNMNKSKTKNNIKDDHLIQQELKELAPLAFKARVAAKKYARERSRLPGRIGSMLYDGYRQWRRYGKWDNSGMSWDQIWDKYEDQVLGEVMEEMMLAPSSSSSSPNGGDNSSSSDELATSSTATLLKNYGNEFDDEELTARICLRILERSVATNEMVDKLFRSADLDEENHSSSSSTSSSLSMEENTPLKQRRRRHERQKQRRDRILKDLKAIEEKFDEDIQELLRYSKSTTEEGEKRRQKRGKGAFFWKKSILSSSSSSSSSNNEEVIDANGISQVTAGVTKSTRGGGGGEIEAVNCCSFNELAETNQDVVAAALFAVPNNTATTSTPSPKKARRFRKLAKHEIIALRILATTKQRIAALQATKGD